MSTYKAILVAGAALATVMIATPAQAQQRTFDLPAQSATRSIPEFGRQAGIQIIAPGGILRSVRTPALRGTYDVRAALRTLLANSGLRIVSDEGGTITLGASREIGAPGEGQAGSAAADSESAETGATPEILVVGQRTLNADIRRTENDSQPYVVFDTEQIQTSQATNIEDFLKNRLPMNAVQQTLTQDGTNGNGFAGQSSINLRGLGTNQTLVLVDGRRLPGVSEITNGDFNQPDINGIPLSAVERIEVLPSTAGGIYGGGATGGVVNIILRRNYTGLDILASYGNSFRADVGEWRIEANGGLSLEGGRTHLSFSASRSASDGLLNGDRDFVRRGRALQFANNPAAFTSLTTPPNGFTPNIRSSNGSNLVLDNGTPLGSPITFIPIGYRGATSDGGQALVANAGRYSLDLPDTIAGARQNLLTRPLRESYTFNARREFGEHIEAFVDFSSLDNVGRSFAAGIPLSATLQANAPNNPFTTPIRISYPATGLSFERTTRSNTIRAAAGLIVRLPMHWTAEADYTWSRSRRTNLSASSWLSSNGTTVGNNGSDLANFDVTRDTNVYPLNLATYSLPVPNNVSGPFGTVLQDASLRIAGPLFTISGGNVTLTALAERRREEAEEGWTDEILTSGASQVRYSPQRHQVVTSFYAELHAPIVSSQNDSRFLRELDLQASIRRDDYSTQSVDRTTRFVPSRGDRPAIAPIYQSNQTGATVFVAALRYKPFNDLMLRASYSTGFLAPSLSQIAESELTFTFPALGVTDPLRGNNPVGADRDASGAPIPVTYSLAGNQDLQPERSRALSAGVVYQPSFVSGLRASIDYSRIEKRNEINGINPLQFILDNEADFPGRVVRGPRLPTDPASWAGPVTFFDASIANIARSRLEAVDLQLDYLRQTSIGRLNIFVAATWQPTLSRAFLPTSPSRNVVDFVDGPLEWRGNFGATLEHGPFTFGLSGQYFDSYAIYLSSATTAVRATAILNQGAARIPSQAYFDIFVRYRWRSLGTELFFGVQNILDSQPPIVATVNTVGGYSFYGDPRLRRFTMSIRKSF